ncbi:hypothetical protein C8A05DRAFT_19224 [Staphylotrichum tortipilum]|uniref:Uncharacterized protein n=1 Tax=Staphylotrichum tortipilum TaxID=2831512 RepID=A0AAN6MD66_9PEZI|nr:hypothetical protein C8A05DRAFT_19224 [Staphylotrichum longicolle]
MAQLVSDFITPVLRQARRFSAGFAAHEPPAIDDPSPAPALGLPHRRSRSAEDAVAAGSAILEGDELGGALTGGPTGLPSSLSSSPSAPSPPSPSPPALPTTPLHPSMPELIPHAINEPSPRPNTPAAATDAPADPVSPATWPLPESSRGTPLPEDDGMGDLRRRIQAIQLLGVAQDTKAQMMHGLLTEKYTILHQQQQHAGPLNVLRKWNPLGEGSGPLNLPLTEEDLRPTYAPVQRWADRAEWWAVGEQPDAAEGAARRLGCEHYRRNVKLQCAACDHWYTCRHCHDAAEDHVLPRQQTKHMLCMLCGCAQKASDTCTKCGQSAAYYYCGICKLWNDDPNKPIYHCPDCDLCRVGQGLGKDFFHCKKCMACVSMSDTNNHKCIERAVDSDCPICNEYLFNSPKSVMFMQCGHSIHLLCFEELKKTSYRCPLCNKSCVNMEYHFRQLDMQILQQPMPQDYADARAVISCNDCCAKSQTAFHWLGLKCAVCQSYNTTQLQLLHMPGGDATAEPPQSLPQSLHPQQEPIFLDPIFLAEELRQRNRAAAAARRREESRQRGPDRDMTPNNAQGLAGLLSTSPSSFSPAFLLRLLNRAASFSEPEQQEAPSSSSPGAKPTLQKGASCPSDGEDDDDEEEEENEDDMLDLFGARDRDFFERMTGLTSAESAVGFDDDEDDDEESRSEEEDSGEDGGGEEEDSDDDEEEDILLLGHR